MPFRGGQESVLMHPLHTGIVFTSEISYSMQRVRTPSTPSNPISITPSPLELIIPKTIIISTILLSIPPMVWMSLDP